MPAFHDDGAYGVEYDNSIGTLVDSLEDKVIATMPECQILEKERTLVR